LLTPPEELEFDLVAEGSTVKAGGLDFWSLPIPDRQPPKSEAEFTDILDRANRALASGKNLLIHCRQGIGRSGMVAACLLGRKGLSPGAAIEKVSASRGVQIPETEEQREWIDRYAPVTK